MVDRATELMIASCVFASLMLLTFIFRLWIRIRMCRMGWEDVWATAAFACGTVNVVSAWAYVIKSGESVVTYTWIYMFTLAFLAWVVRVSIILSIIRIIPAGERLHKYGLTIVALFMLVCLVLVIQKVMHYIHAYQEFLPAPSSPFQCSLPCAMNIMELAVDVTADLIVVAFPLYILRKMTLAPRQHGLLRLLFSSSVLMPFMRCLRTICQAVPKLETWYLVITNVQIALCFFVCNLVVLATYLYRVLGYPRDDGTHDTTDKESSLGHDGGTSSSSMSRHMTLTTIDVLFSTWSDEQVSVSPGGNAVGSHSTRVGHPV